MHGVRDFTPYARSLFARSLEHLVLPHEVRPDDVHVSVQLLRQIDDRFWWRVKLDDEITGKVEQNM